MTEFINQLVSYELFGNSLILYCYFLIYASITYLGFRYFAEICIEKFRNLAKKTSTKIDNLIVSIVSSSRWPLFFVVQLVGFNLFLELAPMASQWISHLNFALLVYIIVKVSFKAVEFSKQKLVTHMTAQNHEVPSTIDLFFKLGKIILVLVAILILISNLGYNVSAIAAGLGIGGIAVAFAVQNILADIFSSLSIYFDQPFKVGDYIHIDEYEGTVKKIGIKTTRIELLEGPELIVANKKLSDSKIINEKQMQERRARFVLTVAYETPIPKLKQVPNLIKNIIDNIDNCHPQRIVLIELGDYSLNFEVVYFVHSRRFIDYALAQQKINFAILEKLAEIDVELTYPKQQLIIPKQDN